MFEEQVAGWLRRVELSPGSDRQAAIVAAAEAVRGEVSPAQCLGIVLLAHAVDDAGAYASLRDAVVAHDDTFGAPIGDLETRLIAGVCSAALLEQGSEVATVTAHSILSARWSGLVPVVEDLPQLAEAALLARSEAHRSRSGFAITTDIAGALKAVPTFPADDGGATHNEIAPLAAALTKALETVKRSIDQAATRISSRLAASDEELDVLWWAFAGYSDLEERPWLDAVAPRGPLVLALELTRLLRFPLEPPSTAAVMSRLLGPNAEAATTLSEVVDDICGSSIEFPRYQGHRLLPILSSVGECYELDRKPSWTDSVTRWGIDAGVSTTQLGLGMQAARELLLSQNLA